MRFKISKAKATFAAISKTDNAGIGYIGLIAASHELISSSLNGETSELHH